MQVLSGDPGRNWRRLARWGALACTVATLIPYGERTPLWGFIGEVIQVASGEGRVNYDDRVQWLVATFCCTAAPIFLGGPAYLLFCNGAAIRSEVNREGQGILMKWLWAATALTPYLAVFRQLPERNRATEMPIAIAISVLSAYLLVCGLSYLASRRLRHTPLYLFSMGILPIGIMFLGWTCFMAFVALVFRFRSRSDGWPMLVTLVGFAGSLALLIGWRGWWRAVKLATAAVAVSAQPMKN